MDTSLILVNFSISPEVEIEFNHFYHRKFLPELMKHSPEIDRIVRYEEFATAGSLRWYNKPFLTFYQLSCSASDNIDEIFARPQVADVIKEFGQWKQRHLTNFARITYVPRWKHRRKRAESALLTGPVFVWQHEVRTESEDEFERWYEDDYLPLQIAEIPSWSGARRYKSVSRNPDRYLTVFETDNEATLARSMTDLRTPQRLSENMSWQRRVEAAVTWQDAATFRPIFCWPD